MSTNVKFSTWLLHTAEERGWSLREMSRRSGLSDSAISLVITEHRNPSANLCIKLAKALGESPVHLLRLADILPPERPAVTEEKEAIGIFRSLPDQIRTIALALLRTLGTQTNPTAALDTLTEQQATYQPRTPAERESARFHAELQDLASEDQQRVFDLMKRLRGDYQTRPEASNVPLEPNP